MELAAPSRRLQPVHLVLPAAAALCLLPFVSAGMALVAGAVVARVAGNAWPGHTAKLARKLLSLSVVGLGAGMQLDVVARVGLRGAGWTVLLIAGALGVGTLLARALRVEPKVGLLVSVGTAICGGSAIAAVAPVIRARDEEVAGALATVFLLNAVALFVFPPLGHLVGFTEPQFGTWAALAIHDTSSVVGAALAYGKEALEVGTTTKLARALWIVPLTLVLSRIGTAGDEGDRAPAARPWFIAGFLAVSALVTFVPALQPAGGVVAAGARRMLVVSLFLVGTGISAGKLKAMGARPLLLGVALWIAVGATTLLAIRFG